MEIHLLFDKTFSSTIKDAKKNKRDNNSDVACQIISAEQKPQSNLLESLRVDQLTEAWVGSKKIFVNPGDNCVFFFFHFAMTTAWSSREWRKGRDAVMKNHHLEYFPIFQSAQLHQT